MPGKLVTVLRTASLPMKSKLIVDRLPEEMPMSILDGVMPRWLKNWPTSVSWRSSENEVWVLSWVRRLVCSATLATAELTAAGVLASKVMTVEVGAVTVDTRSSRPLLALAPALTRNHWPRCKVVKAEPPVGATVAVTVVAVKSAVKVAPTPLVP